MDEGTRHDLLSQLDVAASHLSLSRKRVAAQQGRVAAGKRRGDDTARSESLLANLSESLRLHQAHYDGLLVDLQRW